ncbi:YjbH domain-containing protein [Thalassotalea nanhaiensis]|uniref:YjbH domain-containing protein n=1 Tax=Thalassotalea nanhaiensis TaxID=3065648 RepID=A0ABY9TLE5_9GAMM|nr:YjbH domain-containing protein [Colwelliaceae bacterium SQ345]
MRNLLFPSVVVLLTCGSSLVVNATSSENTQVKNSSSMQAYSGVFNTPNAEVVDWGNFAFSYSDNYSDRASQFIDKPGFVVANDMKFAVGLLPNLEVVGRLATRNWDCNSFEESGCGFRDLSGSFKWQVPFIPKDWFSVALGGQDVAGAASFSEAYYLTASKEFNFKSFGALRTSAGVSTSDNTIGYMDGVIGSVEYQPVEYLQVAAEYDANAVNVGVKLFAPERWLPNGWDIHVGAQLYSSDDARNERDQWFSFGISVPLGNSNTRANSKTGTNAPNGSNTLRSESASLRGKTKADPETSSGSVGKETRSLKNTSDTLRSESATLRDRSKVDSKTLEDFAAYLVDYGFESVSVGVMERGTNTPNGSNTLRSESAALRGKVEADPETSSVNGGEGTAALRGNDGNIVVVRFENNLFNRDEREAVNVVTDLVRSRLGVDAVIELTNYGLVVSSHAVLQNGGEYASLQADSDWFAEDSIDWLVDDSASAHFVPRLILSPKLVSFIGTEYGAYDYQLVLSSNVQMSLWPGAVIDIRHLSNTLANSDDFDDGEYFKQYYGIKEGIDRRMFHQSFKLPFQITSKFSYGRMDGEFDGGLNETRWANEANTHRVNVLYGEFESEISAWGGKKTLEYTPKLIKYRYRYKPLNWDVELTAGEYMQGDKGFTLRSLHWFGDVQVGVRYRKTKFDDIDGGEEEDFVAFGFSIPLTFGKSMKSSYGVQVRGTEQWDYYVETNLESEGNANLIKTGFGQEPRLYHNLNQAYFNRDRN